MQPIDIVEQVKATYKNYIKTAFPIIDPALRGQVFEKIDDASLLWRGPCLSLQRPYFRTSETISDLAGALRLESRLLSSGEYIDDKGDRHPPFGEWQCQRCRVPLNRLWRLRDQWIPVPRVLHPYPMERFDATHPRWKPYA